MEDQERIQTPETEEVEATTTEAVEVEAPASENAPKQNKLAGFFGKIFGFVKANKWMTAFIATAIALVAAVTVAIVIGVASMPDPAPSEGPETGSYYYEAEKSEYTLVLHSGNQFILNDGVNKIGEYTVSADTITLVFDKESNGSATATVAGDVVTLVYNNQEIRFLKKVNYTVTFDANGGEGGSSVTVLNGKPVEKPADPTKANSLFVGWYQDQALTTPYAFDSSVVTADTTVYAKWVEKVAGQVEYTVDFVGADVENMTTYGGKLYGVPTPTKEGYTFGGWWISDFENADKLTKKYTDDTVFSANTTLFAVWVKTEGEKLASPLVEVSVNGLSWNNVDASTYAVKITSPSGSVVYNDNVSATVLNFDFKDAGEYVIEVVAVANNTANNSDATVRYYNAKALDRVSLFTVVEPSTLIFNSVGADKYYVTVKCGNANHKHEMIYNGNSTVFTFTNCDMKAGGIEFTVTAVKNGYANSVSETFVCERVLDQVTDLTVDSATEKVVWTPVKNAAYYAVTVTVGETKLPTVYVTDAAYSLKNVGAGNVTVKVVPVTRGYLSAEAATVTYTKATLAAPSNVEINNNVISWSAVAGATSYTVKVGAKEFETTSTTLDLTAVDIIFVAGEVVNVSVKATSDAATSLYSDEITAKNNGFVGNLVYSNGVISWSPAIGAGSYKITMNGRNVATVTNANSHVLPFKAAGTYTVVVTYVGTDVQESAEMEITVYEVAFDSRLGTSVAPIYVAAGDALNLPTTSTRPGYTFSGWYNTPSASNGNGRLYNDVFYGEKDSIVLYADWTANTYTITQKIEADATGATDGDVVNAVYNEKFTLPVVASDEGTFLGWYTGVGGTGIQLTDSRGESVSVYTNIKDITAYPYFAGGVLEFVEQKDGTYAVKGGFNMGGVIDIYIPDTYKGQPVTAILENAFLSGSSTDNYDIKTVSLPNTVTRIGVGALETIYYLESIEVREVEGNHEVIYSSSDGALIKNDLGVIYLELFPRMKAGEYTVPEMVDTIRHKAFNRSSYITKLIISKGVTYIADEAIYRCNKLKEIVFEEGGIAPLTIEPTAIYEVKKLTDITLPARVEDLDRKIFDACIILENVNVEEGGVQYGSINGMLTNGEQDTILYCAPTRTGEIEIPSSVLAVGEGAFQGCVGITSVKVHNKMTEIAKGAFVGCASLKTVTFEGGRNTDLVIGEGAFQNNTAITSVKFEESTASTTDLGAVTIGTSAFEGCTGINELTFASTANIEVIGENAFKGCERIPALEIPATTSAIGSSAFAGAKGIRTITFAAGGVNITFGEFVFSGCAQLTSISLPATVTVFDGSVFEGCNNIDTIEVAADNPALVAENGILYDKAKTEIMYFPRGKALDFGTLPSTLTKIGAAAFQSNRLITSVTIPASITEIGAHAFDGCIYLNSLTFATTGAITIGDYAFANCPEIVSVTLPANLTAIGDYAFYQSGLGKTADASVFGTVVIPEAVTSIGKYAFAYTMLGSITVPAAVESIGEGAFYGCKNLETFVVNEGDKALTIGSVEDTVGVFEGTKLATAILSSRTSVVGVKAFYNLTTLTTVTIPEVSKLTTVGEYAFNNNRFATITLPEGLVSIGVEAFRKNSAFTSVTIPSTVTDIGKYAFANTGLSAITFAGADTATTPLSINDYAFANNTNLTTITLPKRLERIYDAVTLGSSISATTTYTVFSGSNQLENIFVADGCTQFSDVGGVLYENNENGQPDKLLYCPRGKSGEVTVPSSVTLVYNMAFLDTKVSKVVFEEMANWNGESTLRIGASMNAKSEQEAGKYAVFGTASSGFYNANVYLTEVVFPAHLASVGSFAFYNVLNPYIENTPGEFKLIFNREAGPVEFGSWAVYNNYGLKEVLLPKVATMSERAFSGNNNLKKVSFAAGSTVEKIGYWSFTNSSVEYLYDIPASVQIIDEYAFGTSPLKEITWEEGSQLHTLGNSAFANSQIKSFVFPETLEIVGGGAFNASALEEITLNSVIKSSLTASGGSIFAGASTKLKRIIVPDDNPYMEYVDGALYSEDYSILMFVLPSIEMNGETTYDLDDRVTVIEAYSFPNFPYAVNLHEGILEIADNAFYQARMTEVTIPASVEILGEYAFSYLPNLTSVKFAENSRLRTLGYGAFSMNDNLTSIALPDGIVSMENSVLSENTALVSVDLPAGLAELPQFTLQYCESLKEVKMYEGLQFIGAGVFDSCSSLETVTIPSTVVEFEDYYNFGVFENCSSLKTVIFAEGSVLSNIPGETFSGCVKLESLNLPNTLTSVAGNAFKNCRSLKSVVIGGTWTDLAADTFKGMTALETVVLPDTVKTIGANAFNGCTNLKNFTLPAGVESIGESAFKGCTSLTSVTFGDKVETIGNFAFDGCTSLATVTFAENSVLASLGDDPTVDSAIFRGTTALTEIALPDSITKLGARVFQNSGLESIDLPSKLTVIGNYAFAGCESLEAVTVPATVKTISDFAFEGCSAMTEANLMSGVEKLGSGVFMNCVSLEKANIPASVMDIAGNPFLNCPALSDFVFDSANTDYVFEGGALMDVGRYTIIYYLPSNVPEGGVYEIPATVGVIAPGAFCDSQIVSISIPEKITSIPSMAFMNSKKLESVTLTNSITSIGDEAFKNCTALESFNIPEVTTSVGAGAFENCASLEAVTFANRTTAITIGERAFKDCTTLASINIPAQVTALSDYMLANTAITEFTVPTAVTSLDAVGVLSGCSQLTTVTIHDGVSGNLGNEFFMNCSSLAAVTLPEGITTIGEIEMLDYQEYSNGDYYFRAYGTSIYSGAFKGCTSLTSIDLSNVKNIGAHAFEGCTSLASVDFKQDMAAIGDYAFANCGFVELKMYDDLYGYLPQDDNGKDLYADLQLGEYVFAGCTSLKKIVLPGTSDPFYTGYYPGFASLRDGMFKDCTALELVVINEDPSVALGAKPFEGVSEDCVVLFANSYYTAEYIHENVCGRDDNYNPVSNFDWLTSTDAMIVGADGGILLKTSTSDSADIKFPVASANNGAPMSSNWKVYENGMIYSYPGNYWDIKLPDGTIMIDEAFFFDADGSIYHPESSGMNREDDYLVGVKNGVLYYPTPVSSENGVLTFENGTKFYVITDPSLYTIDNMFVTFADTVDVTPYNAVIIDTGSAQYVIGSQWYYEDPLTWTQGTQYYTRVIVENGNVSFVKSLPVNDYTEVELTLWTVCKADGTVEFVPEGATVSADGKTINMGGDVKHLLKEVVNGGTTEYVWTLVVADGTEYSEGTAFIYEDGSVIILDI